jgi:sulfite exporter TauE/SafE
MLSTETIYFVLFSTGLAVGFGHCIGMCGPIVVSLSLSLKGRSVVVPHLLYNGGRITTYGLLGGVMGATGSFTRVVASIASLQKGVMIFTGILIVVMGLAMGGWIPLGVIFGDYYNPQGVLSRGFRKLSARAGMETQSTLEGLLIGVGLMLSFGLGTVVALLLIAKLADLGWLKRGDVIYKISSVLMVIVGVYFIIKAVRY